MGTDMGIIERDRFIFDRLLRYLADEKVFRRRDLNKKPTKDITT